MLRLKFIIISSFFLFLSCAKSAPDGILSEKKMSELLTEVAMIDGYLNTLIIDSAKKVMPVLYEEAFKKFDIDSVQFEKNITYYLGNPPLAEKVYANINTKLKGIEMELHKTDSLRSVFVQDSVSRAYRLQADATRMKNALTSVYRDSIPFNYYDNSIYFRSLLVLQVNQNQLKRKEEVINTPAPAPTSESLDSINADSLLKKAEEEVVKEEELVPLEEPKPKDRVRSVRSFGTRKLEVLQSTPSKQ